MKVDELRVLEEDELDTRLKTARRELYELRFKHAVGQLENSSQIARVRHDIARIMTVINERELGISTIQEMPAVGEAPAPKKAARPKRAEFVDEEEEQQAAAGEEAQLPGAEAEAAAVEEPVQAPKRGRRSKEAKS
jgi:large subunit ribosomal protein L29